MQRLTAALSGRYTIERELGAGGMATVYLAHDLKHDRQVAIKVLKPELAAVLGAERFVVEIKTTAALQHPHILPLFDSGSADGFLFYVMPYVQGETLRTKLDRETQFGIDEAVRITREVADALDYAHRHGVIHRDIKPENILLHDGRPMVADFGIALALSAAAGGRMTETGMSLGTPHYMSPEQATADKEITGRSDIYSLGSVLYEMLAGEPPHVGHSAQQIIMKIIAEDVQPVTKHRKAVPANVAAAVAMSLEKLPADRFESAKAFGEALGNSAFVTVSGTASGGGMASGRGGISRRTWWATAAVAAVALVAAVVGWLRPAPKVALSRQRVVLWEHSLAPLLSPGAERAATRAAIAPDGSSIVFVDSVNGTLQLMRKLRGESKATPIAGTEHGVSPFFSPDGKWIGYITTDNKVRKVPVEGGGSITLAQRVNPTYAIGAWMDDGTIVYVGGGGGFGGFLQRVSANGGASRALATDTSTTASSILSISPLPGSRGVLFTTCPGNCAIESAVYVFDFAADSSRLLVANAAGAWYSPTGHLLYTDRAGGLYAMGFDPKRLVRTSESVPVIDGVVPGTFTISQSGTVLYCVNAGASARSELMWVTRGGVAVSLDSTWLSDFGYPALSPDGRSLAVSVTDETTQLWIRRSDGTRQKLTQDGTVNWRPAWTADGRSILFVSNRQGHGENGYDLFRMPVDGSAPPELLLHHTFGVWEGEFSRDGQWLVFRTDEEGGISHIRARRLSGDTALVPIAVDKSPTLQVTLSPDGHWLAYAGNTTGRNEIYITPFPVATSARLVSRDGGSEPRWAHSGRELFFRGPNQLMSVDVTPGPTLGIGTPRPLFALTGYRAARNRQQYDVAPDDEHFVMIKDLGGNAVDDVIFVEHWFPELLAKVKR